MNEQANFSIDQFCAWSGLGRNRVYQLLNAGVLCARKAGKRTLITYEDALRWRDSLPAYSPPTPKGKAAA